MSPSAECRERASHRYDPGAITIVEGDRQIVRTIRCDGAFEEGHCSDDAPAPLKLTVTTSHGPPRCEKWNLGSECWWANEPGSSHGGFPGSIDATGTYTLSGVEGGSTKLIAHVGIASAQATVRVRVVLVENPGHLASDVLAKLDAARDPRGEIHLSSPADEAVWLTDQGDGKPPSVPRLELDKGISAARVHIENQSRSITYDGYFASAPIMLGRATWDAISRSTEQNEALTARVHAIVGGAVTMPVEQRWQIDHGNFYHSPEDKQEEARSKVEREEREREWIRTHAYIARDEAVALAVQYLKDQGFTAAPPAGPVHHDIMDMGTNPEILASRHASMNTEPVGTLKKAGWWWVAFRMVNPRDPCRVRVVAVSADGARKRMIHQDIPLENFD